MGDNLCGQLGDGTHRKTNHPEQVMAGSSGYNQISAPLFSGDSVCLSFVGMAGTNYALDRSFSLSPANWVPQVTDPARAGGVRMFINTANPSTNSFWRIRFVP